MVSIDKTTCIHQTPHIYTARNRKLSMNCTLLSRLYGAVQQVPSYYIIDFSIWFIFYLTAHSTYSTSFAAIIIKHKVCCKTCGDRAGMRPKSFCVRSVVRHYITFWINYSFRKLVTLFIKTVSVCVESARTVVEIAYCERATTSSKKTSSAKQRKYKNACARHQCVCVLYYKAPYECNNYGSIFINAGYYHYTIAVILYYRLQFER